MDKYGVVEGTVKTASADNEGDPIGAAAKCIRDAQSAIGGLKAAVDGLKEGQVKKEDGPEGA